MWIQLKAIVLGVWNFLVPFIQMFLTSAGVALANAAMQAVAAVAADNTILANEDKRKAAFDRIVADLTASGIRIGVEVTTSMINGAIEAAVRNQKATG